MTIPKEPFDGLLDWLDPNRERAGLRYEVIRAGLIRIFVSKGFSDAEHSADDVIDRVMKRLPGIRADYVGDPAWYFRGVARNVILEARRNKEVVTDVLPEGVSQEPVSSDASECLSECLKLLPREKQEFILDYHLHQGRAKIDHHREMAGELSITEGALRTRAHHLRVSLEKCVLQCLDHGGGNKSAVPSHKQ